MKWFVFILVAGIIFFNGCRNPQTGVEFELSFDNEAQMNNVVNTVRSLSLPNFKEKELEGNYWAFECDFILEKGTLKRAFPNKQDFKLAEVMQIEMLYKHLPEEIQNKVNLDFSGIEVLYRANVSQEVDKIIKQELQLADVNGELPFIYNSEFREETKDYQIHLVSKVGQYPLADHIVMVNMGLDLNNQPWLTLKFDPSGTSTIKEVTEYSLGIPLAMMLYDQVVMVPIVNKTVKGGVLPLATKHSQYLVFSKLFYGDLNSVEKIKMSINKN